MKSKDEFMEAFADEFAGFILSAFTQAQKQDFTDKGRFIVHRLESVRPLLAKMHDFIAETKPAFVPRDMTIDDQADALIKRWSNLQPDAQKRLIEKLRSAFTPPKELEPDKNEANQRNSTAIVPRKDTVRVLSKDMQDRA